MKVYVVKGAEYVYGLYLHYEDARRFAEELTEDGIPTLPVHARRVYDHCPSEDELDKLTDF